MRGKELTPNPQRDDPRPLPGHGLPLRCRRALETTKTIGFYRMSAPLRNYIFPRALALRLPGGLCSPNAFRSRYHARAEHLAHCLPTHPRGPFHTKRRRHLTIPAHFNGQLANPPISYRLCSNCFTSYRLCKLYNSSFDSIGSCRRRGSPLPRTGYPETRGRRRGRRQKIIPTQCRHQT